jgi:hypothetical protein
MDLGEERIEALGKRMECAPERQVTIAPQQPVCLAIPDRRVDPVPRRRGVNEIERSRFALPRLERLDVDLDGQARQVSAPTLGEGGSQFHTDDREASLQRRASRLAGRAADLQQTITRLESAQLDQVVEELVGVLGTSSVVKICRRIEGATERLARLVARPPRRRLRHDLVSICRPRCTRSDT